MVNGILCDGKTSCVQDSSIYWDESGLVHFKSGDIAPIAIANITISPRLANTTRFLKLPDGSQFETRDNDAIDALAQLKGGHSNSANKFIYALETHKVWVLSAFIILVVSVGGFVKYGIPYFSNEIAMTMPTKVSTFMGDNMQKGLDEYWKGKSTIEPSRQEELRKLYASLLPKDAGNFKWALVFKQGGVVGANAFALPNGTIIFTDELIQLADNDQQIASIMLHEIGHVQHRHSLRTLIQDFTLVILITIVSGDVSTSSSIITALPATLLESGYSQNMEWESDTYALNYMQKHGLDPNSFAEIMTKMEGLHASADKDRTLESCDADKTTESEKEAEIDKTIADQEPTIEAQEASAIWQYFSSHPATEERIERFRHAAQPL